MRTESAKHIDAQLVINPANFFNDKMARQEFSALTKFTVDSFKTSFGIGNYSNSTEIYLYPQTDGKMGYFKDSKLTDGGWIRAWSFGELMYKLCAMIIGEQKMQIVSHDWKDLYIMNYLVDSKELRTSWHFHDEKGFGQSGIPTCRSCGAHWPV